MKIRIDPLDTAFSKLIRAQRPVCEICQKNKATQIHHWKGRRYQSVRFDPDNVWAVCFFCHRKFEEDPEFSMFVMKKRLGKRFDAFILKANTPKPKYMVDRKLLKIWMEQEMKKVMK